MNTCTVIGCSGLKYPTSSLLIEISLYSGKSWSGTIRVDIRWVEGEMRLSWWWVVVEWSWADYFSVCSWFSCRGAEQLMGYLLDGWRRCFECLREVVRAVQRDCSHSLRECCGHQAWCRSIWDRTSSSWVKLWVEWCQVRHVGILLPS